MSLRVTLLGTGGSAGVPHIGGFDGAGDWGACDPAEARNVRTRSSILLQKFDITGKMNSVLVDTGPDMRGQMLACRVDRVDAIVFTHAHADHITGLDDVRMLNRIIGRPLAAFGTQRTMDELTARFAYAFREWEPPYFFRPVMLPNVVEPGDTINAAGVSIDVYDQDHGFSRSLGLRIGRFGYSTDAVDLDNAAFATLAGIDTWVVGCFQRAPHKTHAWVERVIGWTEKLKPRRTILTHMGNDMDWAWLRSNLPAGIEPGYDGLTIDLA